MSVLSAEQVAQILAQVGFTGENLVAMTAIGKRESGYKTDAIRTDNPGGQTGDWGLFQINYSNLPSLRAIGITSMSQLLDPVTNARAAYFLYQQAGSLSPWGMGSHGWTAGGDPFKNTNMAAAGQAVQNAQRMGLLGTAYTGGASTTVQGATPGPAMTSGPITLPSDTHIYITPGVTKDGSYVWAVYDVGGGVKLAYNVMTGPQSNWKQFQATYVQPDQWNQMAVTYAGTTGELGTVTGTFGNFKSFWDSILSRVMGPFNPARNDPEIQRILAEFASRPDMDPAELQNKLQTTQWYQQHTTGELEWNGLSAAEQDKRREQAKAQAADTWFQYVGERIDPGDARIANYVEGLASGKMGWGAFSSIVKQQALGVAESPYNRDIRTEQENQRQRGIDVENTAQNVRDTLRKWGLQWTDGNIMDWAKRIVEKVSSDDDLLQSVKQQAATLYPWKDPEMETMQAAQPWLQVYEKRFDGQQGSLTDPLIQGALLRGTLPFDFDKEIKNSTKWMTTRNAREELTSAGFAIGQKMGFT